MQTHNRRTDTDSEGHSNDLSGPVWSRYLLQRYGISRNGRRGIDRYSYEELRLTGLNVLEKRYIQWQRQLLRVMRRLHARTKRNSFRFSLGRRKVVVSIDKICSKTKTLTTKKGVLKSSIDTVTLIDVTTTSIVRYDRRENINAMCSVFGHRAH